MSFFKKFKANFNVRNPKNKKVHEKETLGVQCLKYKIISEFTEEQVFNRNPRHFPEQHFTPTQHRKIQTKSLSETELHWQRLGKEKPQEIKHKNGEIQNTIWPPEIEVEAEKKSTHNNKKNSLVRETETQELNKVAGKTNNDEPKIEVRQPETEVRQPEIEVRQPEIEVRQPKIEVRQPKIEVRQPKIEVSQSNIESILKSTKEEPKKQEQVKISKGKVNFGFQNEEEGSYERFENIDDYVEENSTYYSNQNENDDEKELYVVHKQNYEQNNSFSENEYDKADNSEEEINGELGAKQLPVYNMSTHPKLNPTSLTINGIGKGSNLTTFGNTQKKPDIVGYSNQAANIFFDSDDDSDNGSEMSA